MYTASTAFLEALVDAGVSYLFVNLGSDHPGMVEALAEAAATGRPVPKVVTCPNEMVALSCAHGYAQVSGKAQAVLVHVECGTQAMAGAIHNASRCRIPVLIFAGASPYTQEGELRGSRNEFIHWLQDVHDQRGIVRGYMKYNAEIRTGRNIKQMVHRALQIANSDPKGPAYLMGAREVMEEKLEPVAVDPARWVPVEPAALRNEAVADLARDLAGARRPLIVTTYLGRSHAAVGELVTLAKRLGAGVLESVPTYMNFPSDNPLYLGNQGNEPVQNPALAEADVVVVIDSDVPWIPLVNHPSKDAKIYHIDIDPLKESMPVWYIPATRVLRADSDTALWQLNEYLNGVMLDASLVEDRTRHYSAISEARRKKLAGQEQAQDVITAQYLTASVRRHVSRDAMVLNEGITNYVVINDHMASCMPGTRYTSGASSLGWHGGAAIGAKLAFPDREVVCLTGDGSYMFTIPSTVHWMARQYKTPFLEVIYNNRGWKAPRLSALAVHPDGYASKAENLNIAFDPPPDYSGIAAAAGGAWARIVKDPKELDAAIAEAVYTVRHEKRCAVLDVWLSKL
jgi:acetolactate synthase I/II/III large subunit